MNSSDSSGSGQVLKRYQLFEVENFEEKLIKKAKGADIAAEEGTSLEPKVKMATLMSSQGIAVFNDIWYVMGNVKTMENDLPIPDIPEEQAMLFVCSKGVTVTAIQAHAKNIGIWGCEADHTKYIITVGEDIIDEGLMNPVKKAPTGKKVPAVLIKIWEAEKLLDNKYKTLTDYEKEETKLDAKIYPRIIYLDRVVPSQHISSVAISSEMTNIAIGLTTGYVIFVGPFEKMGNSLYTLQDRDIQYVNLTPESGLNFPVTNIHLIESLDPMGKLMWRIFCTCEKAFYFYTVSGKKSTFSAITGLHAMQNEMDAKDELIIIMDSQTNEIRKFKGDELQEKWPIKETGKIRLVGKQLMVIQTSEKNKTIRVYDVDNEIISYQAVVADVLADVVSGTNIYLLLKGGASKIMQCLKEKTNIDKLEAFLRKKHYDVAYKFARNEKFSEEVLADISRYYGDFYLGKVF